MTRRTTYHIAGTALAVEAQDAWAAAAVDAFYAGLYATRDDEPSRAGQSRDPRPAIVIRSTGAALPIPADLRAFDVAGGGRCYTDGRASYIDIEGSVAAIGAQGVDVVEVRLDRSDRLRPLVTPVETPVVTQVLSYALSAALRQRRRFELHSGALVDPATGQGVLIIGPSGSGKSTVTVHLASVGWPFLTDDVLLLSEERGEVVAWPLRQCFAITSQTYAASRFLQAHVEPGASDLQVDEKQLFLPHDIFAADFRDRCVPGTLVFPELTGEPRSRIARLSPADTLARLIRMNPWSCYDRATAPDHLAVCAALAKQSRGYALRAGRDLLEAETSVATIASMTRETVAARGA